MRGLLLTMTEALPEYEEEFNAWYDAEQVPGRLAIPGFVAARRWAADETCDLSVSAAQRVGRYLTTYELERPDVLDSAEYLQHAASTTPWTKRSLEHVVVFRRWACEQINPGDALPSAAATAIFLACGEVPPEHEAEFNRWYDEEHAPLLRKVDGVLAARRFRARVGTPRYIALYDLADELVPESRDWRAAADTAWSRRIDALTQGSEWILRTYLAYRRGT